MSRSTLLFALFACALCDLPSSVVVMNICIMVTAISMQVIISDMVEVLSCVLIVIVRGCWRRGMLSALKQGDNVGLQDVGGGGQSTGDAARRALAPRVAEPGVGCEAGASRVNAVTSAGRGSSAAVSDPESD